MPELPEIETVKLQLARVLVGHQLEGYAIFNARSVQGEMDALKGKRVVGMRRRAKVLLMDFEGDYTIAFHFKMSGQLVYEVTKNESDKVTKRVVGGHPTEDFVGKLPSSHTRVVFKFDMGTLYFNDQRMFGWARVVDSSQVGSWQFLDKFGPEPFEMKEIEFIKRLSKLRKPIKIAIMDQEVIAGVGNIYANDALWEARINPRVASSQLTVEQSSELFKKINLVLEEGIKYGGATAADAKYIDLHGLGGHYQDHFRVYDRAGQKCQRCGSIIEKFVLGGRGTYVCLKCQAK